MEDVWARHAAVLRVADPRLDLLLQGFLKARYDQLEESERGTFEHLLSYPDAILLEWLMGRQIPADKDVAELVNTIRNTGSP